MQTKLTNEQQTINSTDMLIQYCDRAARVGDTSEVTLFEWLQCNFSNLQVVNTLKVWYMKVLACRV